MAETVVRAIYSPELFDKTTGKIGSGAIKLDDLLSSQGVVDQCGESSGVSVFRIDHAGGFGQAAAQFKALVARRTRSGNVREAVGYARLTARSIINIKYGPLALLDDGDEEKSCHAVSKYPPAKPGALSWGPLKGAQFST